MSIWTDFKEITKMGLSISVVFSSVAGYFLGAETIDITTLLLLCFGGYFMVGASNAYNQIIEKDLDALMERTKNRPIPAGRMSVNSAFTIAVLFTLAGITTLYVINQKTAIYGAISIFIYTCVYTPLKTKTPIAVFVGAIPGAIPFMLGWIAARNAFGIEPGTLFAIQFFWQFPHFWAIAWKASDDYAKAGFYLLPSKGGKDFTSAFLILLYSLFLLLVSVLPVVFGFTGNIALFFIIAAGIMMIYPAIQLFKNKSDKAATKVMFVSFIYVPVVLLAWYLDKI